MEDNEPEIAPEIMRLSPEELKRKYPGGLYIIEPLSEARFVSPEDMRTELEDAVRVSEEEMEELEDFEILHDGRLEQGIQELTEIESSGDEQLMHSMYYFNLKNRIERIQKLKERLNDSGWQL